MPETTSPATDNSEELSTNPAQRFVRRSLAWTRLRESGIKFLLACCGVFSLTITLAIIGVLLDETFRFFGRPEVTVSGFLFSAEWHPLLGEKKSFGIWALVSGTLLVTFIAMVIALPLGLVTAVYLSEYARPKVRNILKPVLEVLAGIPTVVYGFFALTVITPLLQKVLSGINVYNALSGGIAVGILCLPTICSLTEDALRAVPRALREGALALGGTKFDVTVKVVVPAALSGIIAAFLLAVARAIGETMIVALACGSMPHLTADPRDEIQTMTGFMVQMATGDVSTAGIEYGSMYAVAFTLFVMTFALTLLGTYVRRRFREAYT